MFRTCCLLSLIFAGFGCVHAAAAAPADANSLHETIAALDTALFDAVNGCEMAKVDAFWADDAEFLHDKSQPMYGRKAIVASIHDNLCGKVKRRLVPGTLEVHSLAGYGAVEMGVHQFLHPGQQDHGVVGEAKFIHLWRHTDAGWKITRVISYDHETVK